jgi:class 3 adenylate cyclase/tetratricopeptide (TPR) repeat protein/ribosomal protein L40E
VALTRCRTCNGGNPEGSKYCGACGSPLQLICGRCGASNPPEARFCNACGNPTAQENRGARKHAESALAISVNLATVSQSASDGERKLVTALFVDIIGSTILEQDLDPEEARAIIDPALKLMIEAVRRYDGYVVQSTGDGIFALFGAPVAHEDHPQRSLYTALRLHEEMRRYSDRLRGDGRPPIQVRAGVNTGEVVVRSIRTGDTQTEYTPIGHTVNLASRLQELANAGSTIISDSTRKLVEGFFALRPLGPVRVKGLSESISVYEVTGLGPLRTRLEKSAGRGLSRFVGREKEKEQFRRTAETVKKGSGRIVAVEAEPGVGKSRLFFEFKSEVSADWNVLEAFSVSHGRASAYLPIVELLHNYFGTGRNESAASRKEKLAAKIEAIDANLDGGLPYLCALLEIEEEKEKLAAMDPQLRRMRTLEALTRLLLSESRRRPLILIVEDLHWLDDESQALLDLLATAIDSARLLLLVSYRPEYRLRWSNKPNCLHLRLEPLASKDAWEMLSDMLGPSADLAILKRRIIETTGGTPFFMEETVQSLFDEGAVEERDGKVQLLKPHSTLKIPPTVQAILAARIDRLRNDEKNLLQTLAVLGREFVRSLARAVAGRSEEELDRLITSLELGQFVYEQPSISDIEYVFKHALTQEVAYNSVLVERRKQLHESVGRAIELLYSDSLDDHLADLAHHFSRSGNREKAVEYLRRAATQALSRGASAQAVKDLEAARNLLKDIPAGIRRDQAELQILNPLGTAYIATRGYAAPEVGPVFQRAREICVTVGEPQQQFAMVFGNFAWRIVRGEMDLALVLANEALAVAEKYDDPGMWMEALFLLGVALFYRGDFAGARDQYEKALALHDDRDRNRLWAARVGEDAGVTHRCYLALALWHLGYPDRALKVNREARELARSIEHPFSLAYAQHHASWLYQLIRMPSETLLFSDEQMRTSAEHGFPLFKATGSIYHAAGQLLQGNAAKAAAALEGGLDAYRATGAGLALPYYLGLLGDAFIQTGNTGEADSMLDEALTAAQTSGDRCHEAELHRLKGELAQREGVQPEVLGQHFSRALDIAKEQGSKAWELKATISLARVQARHGRRTDAGEMLGNLYNSFIEGFCTPDLREAKTLLAELQSA